MTPPPDDEDPPPPKRRRKPPRGLEGFDTGFPEDAEDVDPASPQKALWTESQPTPAVAAPAPAAPVTGPPSSTQPPSSAEPPVAPPLAPSLSYPAFALTAAPDPAPAASTAGPDPTASTAAQLEPLTTLPAVTSDADLRDAVGARPAKWSARKVTPESRIAPSSDGGGDDGGDDGDDGDRPRSRKTIVVSILSLVVGLGVAALVFLGRANSAWFYISCEPDRIVAQQGRSFPPWGESTLDGKQWAAIKIPPEAECTPLETESEADLSTQFRAALVKRASVLLTAKEVTKTDDASALLEQALLHTRSNTDAARDARVEIQRLLGDVAYWRASLKLRDASKALVDAAKQFDDAARQRPRHVTDAGAWANYLRKVVGELEAGPAAAGTAPFPPTTTAPSPTSERPPAPPGVALPVEPGKGSAPEPPPAPPDAGLPTGGVLL